MPVPPPKPPEPTTKPGYFSLPPRAPGGRDHYYGSSSRIDECAPFLFAVVLILMLIIVGLQAWLTL